MSKNMIQWLEIGDLDIHISDGNYSSKYPRSEEFIESGVPFIRANNLVNKSISDEEMYFISPQKHGLLKKGHLKTNDVLISTRGDLGKVALVPKRYNDSNINAQLVLLRPNPHKIDPLYLLYCFEGDRVKGQISQLQTGTALKQLPVGNLKRIKIPLPPLEEQRRIAAILDKADGVRRKRKEAIRLTEELLKSTFLEMFGDPVTNPKGWEVIGLGKISQIQGGLQVTPARKELPLEVPYLRVANVYRDKLLLDEIKNIRVTSSELERINMKAGDILIVEGHGNKEEIGRSSVWDGSIENCVHQNHLIRVRLDPNKAEPIYISAYLNSAGGRCQLTKFGKTTSGLNTISTSNVKATKVLCPPIEMQKRYLDFQRKLTEAKNASVQHLEQSENLFNSLLQRAFRGEL
jgi:type I restriction enzyme S subunit